jgi:hypothetical protein
VGRLAPDPLLRGAAIGLLAYVLLLATSHLLAAAWDTRPPEWDRAVHMTRALQCGDALVAGRWREILDAGYYPPLIHCAAGVLHLLLGRSHLVAVAFTQVALALVVSATGAIGARLSSLTMGVAAALLVPAYTTVFLESRVFMLDLPLTALVALTVLALLRAEGFTRPAWCLAAGVLGGLGLLTKWTYPAFVVPVAVLLWLKAHPPAPRRRRGVLVLLAAGLAGIIALPWYLAHPGLLPSLLSNAYDVGAAEGDPPVASVAGLSYYVGWLVYQLGLPFAALFVVGLARRRAPGLVVLVTWIVAPLVFLTLLRNKDPRFSLPILPAVALLSVAWVERLDSRGARRALVALALGILAHVAYLGWGWPAPDWARGRGDVNAFFPSFPPIADHWPLGEILDAVVQDGGGHGRRTSLSIVPDHPHLSPLTIAYYVERDRLPVRVTRAWRGAPRFVDYALTKTGDQGPSFTTRDSLALMARIEGGDPTLQRFLHPLRELPLPDGSRATLYRVSASPVAGVSAAELTRRLEALRPLAFIGAVRAPNGLRLAVERLSDAETLTGHLGRLAVQGDPVLVGDVRRPHAMLPVRALDVILEDVRIDPHALLAQDELELLDVRRLVIRHAAMTTEDVASAVTRAAPWITTPTVSVADGRIEIAGGVRGIPVAAGLVPELTPGRRAGLALRATAVALGPLSVPPRLVNAVLSFANPMVRLRDVGVTVEIPRLVLEAGRLRLVTP